MYAAYDGGGIWTQKKKLLAFDGSAEDYFGYSVAVHGDRIVGGATGNDNSKGTNAGECLSSSRR